MEVLNKEGTNLRIIIGSLNHDESGAKRLVLDNVITPGAFTPIAINGTGNIETCLTTWDKRLSGGKMVTLQQNYSLPLTTDASNIDKMCFVATGVTIVSDKLVMHLRVIDSPIGNAVASVIDTNAFKLCHHQGPNNTFVTIVMSAY